MADARDPYELVPVTTTGSVYEAEIACSELRAAGIDCFVPNANSSVVYPVLGPLVSPCGVEVLVRAGDLGRARKALQPLEHARKRAIDATKPLDPRGADQLAQRAAWLGLVSGVFPPLAIWMLFYVVRAIAAARVRRPENRRDYRLNLFFAVCFGMGLGTAVTLLFCDTLSTFLINMHL